MKKLFLMAVAAMMATVSVNAQDEWRNEVSIAYGGGSNTDLVSSIYKGIFTGKQSNYWGPVSAEYFFRPIPKLGVGAIVAVGGCDWSDNGEATSTFYTFLPAVKYNWLNKTHFSMYSKLGIGLTIGSDSGIKDSETSSTVNWQVSIMGMEYGSAFRGFLEFGMGEQGIILAGLRYKF